MKQILNILRNNYSDIVKGIIFLLTVTVIVYMLPRKVKFFYEYELGRPWKYETLIADKDIPLLKSQEDLETERADIKMSVTPYFQFQDKVGENMLEATLLSYDSLWLQIYGLSNDEDYRSSIKTYNQQLKTLIDKGVLGELPKFYKLSRNDVINVVRNKEAKPILVEELFSVNEIHSQLNGLFPVFDKYRKLKIQALLPNLQANVLYDSSRTNMEVRSRIENISPWEGVLQQGQLVVSKGEVIDEAKYHLLESIKSDYESNQGKSVWLILLGQVILVTIPLFVFLLWLYFFRRDLFDETKNIFLFFVLITLMVFVSRMTVNFDITYLYIVPLAINVLIIRALYDTRLALIVHLTTVLLVSYFVPNSFQFLFLQVITGIVTIVSVVNLHTRSQFFLTALYVMLSYSLMYVAMVLITTGDFSQVEYQQFILFGLNALLVLFSFPLIFLLEKIFGMMTDISLLEYADTNHKLIRDLSTKAPGTFQHSVQVANLAEEAIRMIGGNPLLVRAGAMYHDIGKSINPTYFTENQPGTYNPHDDLSFEESARIIINHVVEGVELARKHNLPEQLIDFIRTHHGTKMVEYFYRMSLKEKPMDEIDLREFTYPGPIPFSRETCVLMMADAVEAASRSIKDPDEKKISGLVEKIIQNQLEQGQYNNANITMSQINKVKKLFIKRLMSIYHVRIEYPD
jgi:putative nucleotidyltransferase with HDIG domain